MGAVDCREPCDSQETCAWGHGFLGNCGPALVKGIIRRDVAAIKGDCTESQSKGYDGAEATMGPKGATMGPKGATMADTADCREELERAGS